MSALFYRRAFCDTFALRTLAEGKVPDMADVRRRIFVAERGVVSGQPDHFHKNYLEHRLGSDRVKELHQLPGIVLDALAGRFICRVNDRLHIRHDSFADWQDLLPHVSPLAIIVAFLVHEGRGPAPGKDPRAWLKSQIGDTALLCPRVPELEQLIDRDGLNELHMHLNGSTELDILWPDAVGVPDRYLHEMVKSGADFPHETAELYDQIELGLTPFAIWQRLRAARRVRHIAAAELRRRLGGGGDELDYPAWLAAMDVGRRDSACRGIAGLALGHPPIETIHRGPAAAPLIEEAAFLYVWLQALRTPGECGRALGLALWFNLLIQTQIGQISIQQTNQVGFDQFQKFTVIGIREKIERGYRARFRQLNNAAPHRTLRHLEGRFAPKKTLAATLELIAKIVDGWLDFRDCPERSKARGLSGDAPGCLTGTCPGTCKSRTGRRDAELVLVAHFIKRKPPGTKSNRRPPQALDIILRGALRQQVQVVREAIERHPFVRQILRGIDAAANELHAPPEAFAPTFRYLRRHGLPRATYHVGEDFVHLVSGIRACAEARLYLGLGPGDRIGHATALGIAPELWLDRTGPRQMIGSGEHLDNLVYAHQRLLASGHADVAAMLEGEIALASARLYDEEASPALLFKAWEMRGLDILEILELERGSRAIEAPEDLARAAKEKSGRLNTPSRQAELDLIAEAASQHPRAFRLFRHRHKHGTRPPWSTQEIGTGYLPASALTALQADMLKQLATNGVAIETLPTSNVRISAYKKLEDHHLFRWLGLPDAPFDRVPAICVGSDDPGIFATSLRNEYAALYDALKQSFGYRPEEAAAVLSQLNDNALTYRFAPDLSPPK